MPQAAAIDTLPFQRPVADERRQPPSSHVEKKSRTTAKEPDLELRIAALVADHLAGVPSAADEIVATMEPALTAKVYVKVPAQLVTDVYQESWVRFFQGLDPDKKPDSYIAWFLGIVRFVSLEMIRAEGRDAPLPDGADERYQDFAPSPPQLAESAQLRAAIFECLGKIPERYSRLIIGHVRGEPREELCAELHLAEGNFGKLLYRARKSLQKCLGSLARFRDENW